jgi:hypothetical protein
MKKVSFPIMNLVLLVVLATGCSKLKLPQIELDAAKAAVENARLAEAHRYLASDFNTIQSSLDEAIMEIQQEKIKSLVARDYIPVSGKLLKISEEAGNLKMQTEALKAQIRNEDQQVLAILTLLIKEDKELLAKAPKGKEGAAALEAIQSEIMVIEASVNEINALITNGDYLTAQDKVNASKVRAEAIKSELTAAITRTGARR